MDILYLLIPMSVALVLGLIGLFAWALHGGQFDDLEQQGGLIFDPPQAALDRHQPGSSAATEESPLVQRGYDAMTEKL